MCGQDVMKQVRKSSYNQGFWFGIIISSFVWGLFVWIK